MCDMRVLIEMKEDDFLCIKEDKLMICKDVEYNIDELKLVLYILHIFNDKINMIRRGVFTNEDIKEYFDDIVECYNNIYENNYLMELLDKQELFSSGMSKLDEQLDIIENRYVNNCLFKCNNLMYNKFYDFMNFFRKIHVINCEVNNLMIYDSDDDDSNFNKVD